MKTRIEKDPMGVREIPADAYYGIQTLRAVENFPISGLKPFPAFVKATALVKLAAARVNLAAGALKPRVAQAIEQAALEVVDGKLADQFVVDVFQAGAGTSHHMNVNEVLANRAAEILGLARGDTSQVHPNDHVNLGQSTNDVIPTAIRLAALELSKGLVQAVDVAAQTLSAKAREFATVVKSGRTHLQDAAPIMLGQEVGAWARTLSRHALWIENERDTLKPLGIGGSAVGTGLNTPKGYREAMARELSALTGEALTPTDDYFEAMQSMAPFAALSGAVRNLALDVTRICNDLRLLSSGPNTGLGELILPEVQPGSSIMPGKVNPSIVEMVNMVAMQVSGYDHTVALASAAGQLELNVMMPVIAYALLAQLTYFTNALRVLEEKCLRGLAADAKRCRMFAEKSPQLVTALAPRLGYAKAAEVAKKAVAEEKTIKEIVVAEGLLTEKEAASILDPARLTSPTRID
jgi:fumarate hydratase class II/aspartate ammonia-lyase